MGLFLFNVGSYILLPSCSYTYYYMVCLFTLADDRIQREKEGGGRFERCFAKDDYGVHETNGSRFVNVNILIKSDIIFVTPTEL